MRSVIKVSSWFCYLYFLLNIVPLTMGKEISYESDVAKFLLDRILEARSKVDNFKCTAIYHDYKPKIAQKNKIKQLEKQGLSPEHIESLFSRIEKNSEYKIQEHHLAFDNEGRARVEMIIGDSDTVGNLIQINTKRISTWDGENAIQYGEKSGNVVPGAILSNEQPFETSKRVRQPWQQFGGNFCNHLAKAINDNMQIEIKKEENGTYRVEINDSDVKKIAVIDPSCGYSVIQQETYFNGHLTKRCIAKFAENSMGVWFPIEGEDIRFSKDDPKILKLKSTLTISEIIINDPNFYNGLFHVDFPKGTRVIDNTTGLQYIVGEPMSEKMKGITNAQNLGDIALDTLDEMAEESNLKQQEIELFIPEINISIEKGESFVLDFSDGKLLNPLKKPESKDSNKYLTELGKGDISWDGNVVTSRGAKVLTIKQESERPLKFTEGKWTGSYKLPEKVELPYSMLVVTNEGVNYLMKIIKIESGGITITYTELNPDELILYKQKK